MAIVDDVMATAFSIISAANTFYPLVWLLGEQIFE